MWEDKDSYGGTPHKGGCIRASRLLENESYGQGWSWSNGTGTGLSSSLAPSTLAHRSASNKADVSYFQPAHNLKESIVC